MKTYKENQNEKDTSSEGSEANHDWLSGGVKEWWTQHDGGERGI